MNSDLRRRVHDRLISEGLISKNWSSLVPAACDGRDALDGVLQNAKTTAKADEKATATTHAGAYLTSLTVEGWGGRPRPDHHRRAQRVGEVQLRRRISWGVKTAAIEAKLDLEGGGQATVSCSWDAGCELSEQKTAAQIKGRPKTISWAPCWTKAPRNSTAQSVVAWLTPSPGVVSIKTRTGRSHMTAGWIVTNPGILGGKPCIRGTRLSVEFLLELAGSGANQNEILTSYPQLTAEALAAAFSYAAQVIKHDRTIDLPQPA